jgi:hypothetical protein
MFILADGLRPDAVTPGVMPSLDAMGRRYTVARHARTVRPSATVAALASLATGVSPATHRLVEPGLGFLPQLRSLRPLARELARGGIATDVVMSELPALARPVASALAAAAGVNDLVASGRRARETATAVRRRMFRRGERLLFVYLPDCDRAGHARGWMSPAYLEAAAEVDAAIGSLADWAEDALCVVVADHGGGGVSPTDHDQPHPINDHIPLVLAGPDIARHHELSRPVSILDLPPTLLWWFGLEIPACYEGRPLAEAFVREPRALEAIA